MVIASFSGNLRRFQLQHLTRKPPGCRPLFQLAPPSGSKIEFGRFREPCQPDDLENASQLLLAMQDDLENSPQKRNGNIENKMAENAINENPDTT